MPMKISFRKFYADRCKAIGYHLLRPSVIGGKMLRRNNNFISKYMVFYLLAKFFHFTAQRK
jgi:hypothetical protein